MNLPIQAQSVVRQVSANTDVAKTGINPSYYPPETCCLPYERCLGLCGVDGQGRPHCYGYCASYQE